MFEINEVAVLVAAILAMAVGSVWYSPVLFGNAWMKAVGMDPDIVEMSGMWKYVLAGFAAQFVTLYVLAHFLFLADAFAGANVLLAAVWLTVMVAAITSNIVIWEGKSLKYFFINNGYTAVVLVGGGAVISYWPW